MELQSNIVTPEVQPIIPEQSTVDSGVELRPYISNDYVPENLIPFSETLKQTEEEYKDFKVLPTKLPIKPIPISEASDTAFYASATSDNPYEKYNKMLSELVNTGESAAVKAAQNTWIQEQDYTTKQAISDIMGDSTIPKLQKIKILNDYSESKFISKDLKDKFIQKLSTLDNSITVEDRITLDENVKNLTSNLEKVKENKQVQENKKVVKEIVKKAIDKNDQFPLLTDPSLIFDAIEKFGSQITSPSKQIGEGVAFVNFLASAIKFVTSTVTTQITAVGLLPIYNALNPDELANLKKEYKEKGPNASFDYTKAFKTRSLDTYNISRDFGDESTWWLDPSKPVLWFVDQIGLTKEFEQAGTNVAMNSVGEGMNVAADLADNNGIMSKDAALTAMESLLIATPFLANTIKTKVKKIKEDIKNKNFVGPDKPTFTGPPEPTFVGPPELIKKADTPFDNTLVANPAIAKDIAKAILVDNDIKAGEVFKIDSPTLIQEFVFPKLEETYDFKNNIDLKNIMLRLVKEQKEIWIDKLFDPSLINIKERIEYFDVLNKIKNESLNYYNQSLSVFHPTTNSIFGKMVFTKDEVSNFNTTTDVIHRYEKIKDQIKDLELAPEELGNLVIKDVITGKEYTPELLLKETSLNTLLTPNQYRVEWYYKHDYDLLDIHMYGLDSSRFKSKAVNAFSTSWLGNFVLSSGRFTKWFDESVSNSALRASNISRNQLKYITSELDPFVLSLTAPFRLRNGLNHILKRGELEFKDSYTIKETEALLLEVGITKEKDILKINKLHSLVRQIAHFQYNVLNNLKIQELTKEGYQQSLYKGEVSLQPVKTLFSFSEEIYPGVFTKEPVTIWDFVTESAIPFDIYKGPEINKGVFHSNGQQIVRLRHPKETSDGRVYNYALVGPGFKIDILPQYVVPRIRGWMPKYTDAHRFISRVPESLYVDGILLDNSTSLGARRLEDFHRETVGAANSNYDANKIVKNLEEKQRIDNLNAVILKQPYKKYNFFIEIAKEDNANDYTRDVELQQTNLRNSKLRGDKLETLNNEDLLENPLVTLFKTVSSTSQLAAYKDFTSISRDNFVKSFRDLLPSDEFPIQRDDIKKPAMNEANRNQRYKQALAVWDKLKFLQLGSPDPLTYAIKWPLKAVDFFLDTNPVTNELSKIAKNISNKSEFIVAYPTKVVSTLAIATNVVFKHWLQQPVNYFSMLLISGPKNGYANLAVMPHLLMEFTKNTMVFNKYKEGIEKYSEYITNKSKLHTDFKKDGITIDSQYIKDLYKAIKSSGFIDNIDAHMAAQGMFTGSNVNLKQNIFQKTAAIARRPFEVAASIITNAGFNAGEFINRVGTWVAVKSVWEQQNPGKDWRTPESIAEITYQANQLTGSMQKANSYSYQNLPLLKWFTQFESFGMKNIENVYNPQANFLTTGQRVKLQALYIAQYGVGYGVPLGVSLAIIDSLRDDPDEGTKLFVEWADKGGLNDWILNSAVSVGSNERTNIIFSKGMSPYSSQLGGVFGSILKLAAKAVGKELDPNDKRGTPSAEKLGQIIDKVKRYSLFYQTNEITLENHMVVIKDVLKLSEGFNKLSKAIIASNTGEIYNDYNQPLGVHLTKREVWLGTFLGFSTLEESNKYLAKAAIADIETKKKDMIDSIVKTYTMAHKSDADPMLYLNMMPSLNAVLLKRGFDEQDIDDINTRVLEKFDKMKTSGEEGITNYISRNIHEHYSDLKVKLLNAAEITKNKDLKEFIDTVRATYEPASNENMEVEVEFLNKGKE